MPTAKKKAAGAVSKKGLNVRVPTGILGFDKLIEGGFPNKSSILVAGGPGASKTIFCLQYLYNGATRFNDNGLYIAFEEGKEAVYEQAKQFGWDYYALEKKGKLVFFEVLTREINNTLFSELREIVKKFNIKRIAIDSLGDMCFSTKLSTIYAPEMHSGPVTNEYQVKRVVQVFVTEIRKLGCTNLFVSDTVDNGPDITRDGVSEFVCDGLVLIKFESLGGEFARTLLVRKMRRTRNDEDLHPLEISKKGLIVHTIEK